MDSEKPNQTEDVTTGDSRQESKATSSDVEADTSGHCEPRVFKSNPHPATIDFRVLNEQINHRLAQWRPRSWEDDISRHALDNQPFENLGPPSQLKSDAFNPGMLNKVLELVGTDSLDEFINRDIFPIPSADDREGYSPAHHGNYWLSGFQDYYKIQQVVNDLNTDVRSYLDFGCASGRVIRHFCAQTDIPEIWGTDINARHIRWLCEFLPQNVRPIANHCLPSIPIADASVDVISAFSVFTHIDTFETCWLTELSRILRPGGFAYLTVHNEDTWNAIRDEIDNPNNRLVQSLIKIDPDTRQKLQQPLAKTRSVYRFTDFGPYRAQVFHSNDYLHQVWGRFFNIHEILPCHHVKQTVLVLTKK